MSFKLRVAVIAVTMAFLLTGCGGGDEASSTPETVIDSNYESKAFEVTDMFSDRDKDVSYDNASAKTVTLSDKTATVASAGTYILSGKISDGQIIVDASKDDKIQLVLDGVDITSTTSAAIYVKQADKVFITLAEESENKLSNTKSFTADGDTNVDGVIFSKDDLTINGNGSLTVTSADHGIVCKDDLVIASGKISVETPSHAISAKDSIRICGGEFTLDSGKDGLHAENSEDAELGYIYVSGGAFSITSDGDGLDASAKLQIDSGTFDITSGGGADNASPQGNDFGFGLGYGRPQDSQSETDTVSCKGIKSTGALIVTGGSFTVDSADDAVHSNASLEVRGGNFDIKTGDDGFHADEALYISNGDIFIRESYEGLEGLTIDITGGNINLVASDDGLNAAGGHDQSGYDGPGGPMRPDAFGASSDSWIKILGGNLNINASGDGVDSNGALYISGGETYVSGPTNSGNGALDFGSVAEISGGIFVATGASGMAENFTSGSAQGAIMITAQGGANVTVTLKDSEGNILMTFTPEKSYNSVVLSHPSIIKDGKYTVTVGSNSYEIEMDDIIYSMGGMGGMGGFGGPGGRPGAHYY